MAGASGVVRRGDFAYVIADDELRPRRLSDLRLPSLARLARCLRRLAARRRVRAKEREARPRGADRPAAVRRHAVRRAARPGLRLGRRRATATAGSSGRSAPDGSLEGEPTVIDLSPIYGAASRGARWSQRRGRGRARRRALALSPRQRGRRRQRRRGDRALRPRGLAHRRSRHRRRGAQGASRVRPRRDGRRRRSASRTRRRSQDDLVCFTASAEGDEDGDIRGSVVGTISGSRRGAGACARSTASGRSRASMPRSTPA